MLRFTKNLSRVRQIGILTNTIILAGKEFWTLYQKQGEWNVGTEISLRFKNNDNVWI